MNNFIIFEGANNTGKSTVINLLKQYLIDEKNKPPLILYFSDLNKLYKEKEIEEYESLNIFYYKSIYNNILELFKNSDNLVVIADRSHIGEFIYGRLFRNHNDKYFNKFFKEINNIVKEMKKYTKIELYHLNQNISTLLKRNDKETPADINFITQELNLFSKYIPVYTKDFDNVYNIRIQNDFKKQSLKELYRYFDIAFSSVTKKEG